MPAATQPGRPSSDSFDSVEFETSPYGQRTRPSGGISGTAAVPALRLAVYGAVLGAVLVAGGLLPALATAAGAVGVELLIGWYHRARLRA